MSDLLQDKLGAQAWQQLIEGRIKGPLDVLIRTEVSITSREQAELQATGFNTRYMIKNVLSGSISEAKHLENIAKLAFVSKIELSSLMFEES